MSRRVTALFALATLLVAGVVAAFGLAGHRAADDLPEPIPEATTSTTVAAPVAQVVRDVEAFVSRTRGLAFKRPVPVSLLDGQPFKDRLLQDAGDDRADIDISQQVLRAVHLIGKDVHLYDVLLRFIGDAVVGFYDTKRHVLVLRAGAFSPYARITLAHELTHALDDQWFGLDRPELDRAGNDEASLAFQALTEGNAVRVQEIYRSRLSVAEQTQADLEEARLAAGVDYDGVPPVIPELIGFPYVDGPPFVRALLAAGGEPRVNEAFRHPPTTSEDIVDPAGWLAGRRATPVAIPPASGKVIDKGIYGYSSLVLTLEPVVGLQRAEQAANGWAGDGYVAWDAGHGTACVRATFVMDTAKDVDELTTALQRWARSDGATVDRQPGRVSFTSCG